MTKSTANRRLTARQARFAEEYLVDLCATNAAKRAGYSHKTAERQGYQLLQKSSVKARIEELQAESARRLEVTADDVTRMLLQSYDDARKAAQHGPQIRSVELLGKRLGMFRDRVLVDDMARISNEDLFRAIAGDDPRRLALARELLHIPTDFEEDPTRH